MRAFKPLSALALTATLLAGPATAAPDYTLDLMDQERLRPVFVAVLERFAREFPAFDDRLHVFISPTGGWPSGKCGYTYPEGEQVTVNRACVRHSNSKGSNGISASGKYSLKTLLWHELGHVVYNRSGGKLRPMARSMGGEERFADGFREKAFRAKVARKLAR